MVFRMITTGNYKSPLDNSSAEDRLTSERLRVDLLFRQGHTAFVAILVNATIYPIISWNIVSRAHLVYWYLFICSSTFLRFILYRRWQNLQPKSIATVKAWERYFLLGLFSSALSWGILGSLLLQVNNPLHFILTMFLLAGMTSGATVSCSASSKAIAIFVLTANVPAIIRLALLKEEIYLIMAGIIAMYALLMIKLGRRLNHQTINSLKLRFENKELVIKLKNEMKERDKNERLKKERDLAESANRAKSEFLANASHEIRTPVAAISGFADLLSSSNLVKGEARKFAEIVKKNSEHLLSLTNDLLNLSKAEKNLDIKESLNSHFSPVIEIDTVTEMFRSELKKKDIPMTVDYIGPIPKTIFSNPQAFRQILINLISNAVKYTDQGHIEVSVRLELYLHGKIDPRLFIVITDTGYGISSETQKLLFEPFMRGKTTRVQNKTGAGLGLALSLKLAEQLSGSIHLVKSVDGVGSSFEICIPTGSLNDIPLIKVPRNGASQDKSYEDLSSTQIAQKLSGRSVLVVDDNQEIQYLVETLLKKSGARTVTCSNGPEALRQSQQQEFDLIVLDIKMPEMTGYEVAEKLRLEGFSKPIIALSAHASIDDQQRCFQLGFDDFLQKPIDQVQFIDAVALHVKKSALSD